MWKERLVNISNSLGLDLLDPVIRLCARDEPVVQLKRLWLYIGVPCITGMVLCLMWQRSASLIQTKYGSVPKPTDVWQAASGLLRAHRETRAAETDFYARQRDLAARLTAQATATAAQASDAKDPAAKAKLTQAAENFRQSSSQALSRRFSSPPTYLDQIATSLKTVFTGFCVASLLAVPVGVLCGISRTFMAAVNPLVQILKPVSPLAWLPIVMIVVGSVYETDPSEAWFAKSFISSALTVALCSLWPTLVNTAIGVSSIDKDYLNVAKVLQLSWTTRLRKIIVPASMPYIFTGLRISLGVGWMVLIAAEMLAQNPGLGKFIWDMFQNGSRQTLAQIIVAVITIGLIGFALDRFMIALQRCVSHSTAT